MLYWMKVYGLIAVLVFTPAGMMILTLFAWQKARAYAAARHRIRERLSRLITQPHFLANVLAISRSFSRSDAPPQLTPPNTQ